MKQAQGATEYLIILAVVIIIALIVVGVMGGIPGIGPVRGSDNETETDPNQVAIILHQEKLENCFKSCENLITQEAWEESFELVRFGCEIKCTDLAIVVY